MIKAAITRLLNKLSKPQKIKKCLECGINPRDYPSDLCCGCNSYKEHL